MGQKSAGPIYMTANNYSGNSSVVITCYNHFYTPGLLKNSISFSIEVVDPQTEINTAVQDKTIELLGPDQQWGIAEAIKALNISAAIKD